jgi:hypothetical protein
LDPETGTCVYTKEQLETPVTKIQEAIKDVQEGRYHPDREKKELSRALGNPEHPGRTQGTSGSVLWVLGFPDSTGYRSRGRKKKEEADRMQRVEERLALHEKKLEALTSQRATGPPSQQHEDPSFDTAHEATPPS